MLVNIQLFQPIFFFFLGQRMFIGVFQLQPESLQPAHHWTTYCPNKAQTVAIILTRFHSGPSRVWKRIAARTQTRNLRGSAKVIVLARSTRKNPKSVDRAASKTRRNRGMSFRQRTASCVHARSSYKRSVSTSALRFWNDAPRSTLLSAPVITLPSCRNNCKPFRSPSRKKKTPDSNWAN